jgi:hypothetical protein
MMPSLTNRVSTPPAEKSTSVRLASTVGIVGARVGGLGASVGVLKGVLVGALVSFVGAAGAVVGDARTGAFGTGPEPPVVGATSTGTFTLVGIEAGIGVGTFGAAVAEDIIGARTGALGTGPEPPVVGATSTGTFTLAGIEAGFEIGDTTGT